MNFQELQTRLCRNLIESEWHQHPNGKGWVQNTARVDSSVYVFGSAQVFGNARVLGDARVYGNAQVSGDARVSGDAWVSGSAQVSGYARVSGDAWVSGSAQVSGSARVFGDAWVSGSAQVSGDARVSGDAWEISPLFMHGSKHSVTTCSHTSLQIGCKKFTVSEWKLKFREIGQQEEYNESEILEYGIIIELAAQWLESKFPTAS